MSAHKTASVVGVGTLAPSRAVGVMRSRHCRCGTPSDGKAQCGACARKHGSLQRKHRTAAAHDPLEAEADRVADGVLARAPDAARGLSTMRLARIGAIDGATNSSVQRGIGSHAMALPDVLRHEMEQGFGHDFSQVRVHADATAGESAGELDAQAYTVGRDIVFGAGRYAPQTQSGRHLIAHELTHVLQQTGVGTAPAGTSRAGGVVQRKPAPPKTVTPKPTAADAPKLNAQAAKNPPPCACLVFIHHSERNARLTARALHEFCRYNLAIVEPTGNEREIDLPGTGKIDPNELFPRNIAEECWNDDKPCNDFMAANAGKSRAAVVKEFVQRQFFLAIKKCSNQFTLPVIGLHNNTIDDTASYRKSLAKTSGAPDLKPIRGKVFDDQLKPGDKAPADTLPFKELHDWLKKLGGVEDDSKKAGKKNDLKGGPLQKGKTNIFLWCSAADNSKCQIGDPEHPDNVVWVTNPADFAKLRGTKTNVALQTSVDPAGNSATDLSSLFVFLADIMGKHFDSIQAKLKLDTDADLKAFSAALGRLLTEVPSGADPEVERMLDIARVVLHAARAQHLTQESAKSDTERKKKAAELRFANIETPDSAGDPSVSDADFRVTSLHNVKSTLAALGVDCCDTKAAAGETDSATDKVEKAVRAGKLPEAPAKK